MVREQLGAPDSAEIHLAITRVAELLLPLAAASSLDERLQRITALRIASGAVLFGWPISAAKQEARVQFHLPLEEGSELPRPWISNEKDWLAEAVDQLRSEGVHVSPSFQRQRSNYGWRHLEDPSTSGQTEA